MNPIKATVYLSDHQGTPPMDVVYGSDVPIELTVGDVQQFPQKSTAAAYANAFNTHEVYVNQGAVTVTGNKIKFTPDHGFFAVGDNFLVVKVHPDGDTGDGYPFPLIVHCHPNPAWGTIPANPVDIKGYAEQAKASAEQAAAVLEEIKANYPMVATLSNDVNRLKEDLADLSDDVETISEDGTKPAHFAWEVGGISSGEDYNSSKYLRTKGYYKTKNVTVNVSDGWHYYIVYYNADKSFAISVGWNVKGGTLNEQYPYFRVLLNRTSTSGSEDMVVEYGANFTGYYTTNIAKLFAAYTPEIPKYFADEVKKTTADALSKMGRPCLVYSIITDNHVQDNTRDAERQKETLANIRELNASLHCDAIVHLGDVVHRNLSTGGKTDAEIQLIANEYMQSLSGCNRNVFACNGNHDGYSANNFSPTWWYPISRCNNNNIVVRNGNEPYFYVDNAQMKIRSVFLATPDNPTGGSTLYGYSERMLLWLKDALNVENNWEIMIFAHIAPFSSNASINRSTFFGMCNAFHNHGSFADDVISCDYTGRTGTKLVSYICGHSHGDYICNAGATSSTGVVNELPCAVIMVGCNQFDGVADIGVAPARQDKTLTQDLWDVMVYNQLAHKISMLRFGAGSDREIIVP